MILNKEKQDIIDLLSEPKEKNLELYYPINDLISSNIKYLIRSKGFKLAEFYRLLNEKGIRAKIEVIQNKSKGRRTNTALLFVLTMSRIFSVNYIDLISQDLRPPPTDGTRPEGP